jgi:DNA-binding IclR family transcriptional regulator
MFKSKKLAVLVSILAVSAVGFTSSASARLINQKSQGHGIKCFAVPVTQANGTVVYTNVCRKVGV